MLRRLLSGGSLGGPVGANGHYSTGKSIPPGKYAVGFNSQCGSGLGIASANWAPEWYRGKFRQSAASVVVVKASQITRGIGAIMRRGGVISGQVTTPARHGLGGVCVVAVTPKDDFVQQVTTSRDGRYRFQGLDPGQYGVGFFPHCGRTSAYLPQWWPGRPAETKTGLIRTGFGTARTHIDAQLVLGGAISGEVRLRGQHGRPIKGICVDVSLASGNSGSEEIAASNAKGEYAIRGLLAGRYSVSFYPGCNNNGNYLSQNYAHSVTVRLSRLTSGINGFIQPSAIIKGTVTAKVGGARLAGICVATGDSFSAAFTGANGTYVLDQIPPGKVQVQFFNCATHGSYAPRSAAAGKLHFGQVVSGIDVAMAPGATISGTIALPSGRKLSNVCVSAFPSNSADDLGEGGAQSHRGQYAIQNLSPGLYQVLYTACGGPSIGDTWFMEPGKTTEDESRADQIYVPAGGVVAGVNAVVPPGGYISGWAFGPRGQQGSDVCMQISNAKTGAVGLFNGFFEVSVGGGYTVFGFAPGRYLVEFYPCSGLNLALQWFDRASRPARATPVLVRPDRTTRNIDVRLTAGGTITGRVVSKATGKPLAGVCVEAVGVGQPFFGGGGTNRSGKYVVTGLNAGSYRLYLTSCGPAHLVPLVTGKLRAIQGKAVAAPGAAMVAYQPGAISGRVAVAGSPRRNATGVCVNAIPVDHGLTSLLESGFGTVGREGAYSIGGLVPGRYKVFADGPDCAAAGLVPQWYKNTSLSSRATVLSVASGQTTRGVSVTLRQDGSISGTVKGPKPADKPLPGICVRAVPVGAGTTPYLAESTVRNGRYRISPLAPGRYLIEFEARCAASGYATQWWPGAASMSHATPVIVRAGQPASGINANMTASADPNRG